MAKRTTNYRYERPENRRWYCRFYTWEQAVDYLSTGRNKNLRPMYHMNLHVRRIEPDNPDSSIGIGYYNPWSLRNGITMQQLDVVIYHKNGTVTVTNNTYWSSARNVAIAYANLVGYLKRNGVLKLRQDTDLPKKAYARPCTKCKGMQTHMFRSPMTGEIITQRCPDCFDGYRRTKEGWYSTSIPNINRLIRLYSGNTTYINFLPASFDVDLSTGRLVSIESGGFLSVTDYRQDEEKAESNTWAEMAKRVKKGVINVRDL